VCYIHRSGILHGGQKSKNHASRALIQNLGFKSIWPCDPSIENFTWSKKKYTLRGQKGKNKLSEPKNRIRSPKSV
jgi:hypothetical protein